MSLWKIAWRSIQQRSLASLLTAISMALGVMLEVAVLVISSVVGHAFNRGGEGYDLIVGPPKGSNLELVLANVFYVGPQKSTMPYRVYQLLNGGHIEINGKLERLDGLTTVVPVCLGDFYQDKRVVATLPDMFELTYDKQDQRDDRTSPSAPPHDSSRSARLENKVYQFAEGKNFGYEKSDYFSAVAGSAAAQQLKLKLGSKLKPTHEAGGKSGDDHGEFTVVGILKPSGTPVDNALFIHIEGFFRVGGHAGQPEPAAGKTSATPAGTPPGGAPIAVAGHAANPPGSEPAGHHDAQDEDVPDSKKYVSAVLVCVDKPNKTSVMVAAINRSTVAQAAIPSQEIAGLLKAIVGNVELVLAVFAVAIVLVSGIGIMVSIYNSMNDRRHEIAIMRALGARRSTVLMVILMESILLSLGGGLLGLGLGHGMLLIAGPWIAEAVNLPLSMLGFYAVELILIPGLILLASIVGLLPAVVAYRTDVGKSLIANP